MINPTIKSCLKLKHSKHSDLHAERDYVPYLFSDGFLVKQPTSKIRYETRLKLTQVRHSSGGLLGDARNPFNKMREAHSFRFNVIFDS